MTVDLTTRNASLEDLAKLLTEQHARKLDLVVPSSKLRAEGGVLAVEGVEPVLTPDGVIPADGYYRPTATCDEGVSAKLGVPLAYLRRMRTERPDLYDANVNGWLHGSGLFDADAMALDGNPLIVNAAPDPRSFLLRCFRGDDGGEGIARAMLSDRFGILDHLDMLTAVLEGAQAVDADVQVQACDLTERRMYVRFVAPAVQELAPNLLRGYRSPYDTRPGEELPVVFAGFVASNSEVGGGGWTITPRLVIRICSNGLTITRDAFKSVHLGSRMDEGAIRWSEDTVRKELDAVTARTRDAVATFVDVDYMRKVLDRLEVHGDTPLLEPAANVETVCNRLKFSDERRAAVLDHFIRGGAPTVGGVMNAVTSVAQLEADADVAFELEALGMRAFEEALELVR